MKKLTCLILILSLISSNVYAAGISIIRDSQTEHFLTDPIFAASGLNADNIKIYIVNDSTVNAFVFGGQNMFINSGLITKYRDPKVLAGVLAHEAGHIAAGHLARGSETMDNAGKALILTYLAGIAAAIAGSGDAGFAMIMGGNHIVTRLALKYNRSQEEAADRLALQYLKTANYPSDGLLELLQFFNSQQIGYKGAIDEYALTHPVSSKRINYVKANVPSDDYKRVMDKQLYAQMAKVVVKLEAFLQDPDKTLKKYDNNSDPLSQYARSIAYFKKGEINKSLKELDALLQEDEKDGYLWELKGQILFESGLVKKSIVAYKKAVELQKDRAHLAKIGLASSIIALDSKDKDLTNFAIDNLLDASKTEGENPNIFKQLSKAYHQIDNQGRAYLALAELYLLKRDETKTIEYAKLAKEKLDKDDKSALIKADDILQIVKKKKAKPTTKKQLNHMIPSF